MAHARVWLDDDTPSQSIGSTSNGRLTHGHPMPLSGSGFVTYSYLGASLGRQYVHGAVRDLLREAFAGCAAARPDRRFVLGETGWPAGGRFQPHRSHENGLSVDVFMPLRDGEGKPAEVATWPWDLFGYRLELDAQGRRGDLRVDFDDLAVLLAEIDARAPAFGLRVEQIIVAPEYVPLVLASPAARRLGKLAGRFLRRPAWWRHDEHVHVDFALVVRR
jgi:penicillin-insensitive murein endopeptidase